MKTIFDMNRMDFYAVQVPEDPFELEIGNFRGLVILPLEDVHESGFTAMDFVASGEDDKPICRFGAHSDVLNIDLFKDPYSHISPEMWTIDCLPKSGLLRLFPLIGDGMWARATSKARIKAGFPISSFLINGVVVETTLGRAFSYTEDKTSNFRFRLKELLKRFVEYALRYPSIDGEEEEDEEDEEEYADVDDFYMED